MTFLICFYHTRICEEVLAIQRGPPWNARGVRADYTRIKSVTIESREPGFPTTASFLNIDHDIFRPGRVVTLIERSYWETLNDHDFEDDDQVWGMAYRIKANRVEEVMRELNIREINGYSIQNDIEVFSSEPGAPTIKTLVYIGTPENPQFIAREGIPGLDELAHHIFNSRGPSGENRDYLYNLHKSLVGLSPAAHDHHVSRLFHRVVAIEAENKIKHLGEHEAVGPGTASQRSKDKQEEVEG